MLCFVGPCVFLYFLLGNRATKCGPPKNTQKKKGGALTSLSFEKLGEREEKKKDLHKEQHEMDRPNTQPLPIPFPSLSPTKYT
jgi:hypothetical protein